MRMTFLNFARLAGTAVLACATALPAHAQDAGELATAWTSVPNGRIRLIAGGAAPDGTRYAALELQLAPGWKTYWRNPGEAGIPPSFDWSKSTNTDAKSIEVLYPAPKRIADGGGELIGYTSSVTFPLRLKATDSAKPIALQGDIALGICRDVCIPVETTLTLDVPASKPSAEPPVPITRALDATPRPHDQRRALDPELLEIKGTVTDGKGRLFVTARRATDLFLEGPDGIFVPLPQKLATPPSGTEPVTFEIDLAQAPDIKDTLGKPIRLTFVGAGGASEAVWIAK
jgi:DsbC/DsbD-like thiol-disulfide interchange protein